MLNEISFYIGLRYNGTLSLSLIEDKPLSLAQVCGYFVTYYVSQPRQRLDNACHDRRGWLEREHIFNKHVTILAHLW